MEGYLILCPADTTWTISSENFSAKILERWPQAATRLIQDQAGTTLDFKIVDDHVDLTGYLSRNGVTIGFDAWEGHAIFACWYRSIVPAEVPLIMMDDDEYEVVYPLTIETTPDDILSERIALRPPPDPQVLFTRRRKTRDD